MTHAMFLRSAAVISAMGLFLLSIHASHVTDARAHRAWLLHQAAIISTHDVLSERAHP